MHQEKRLLSVQEAAPYVGLSPQTIRNQISNGSIPFRYTKIGKLVRFDVKDLDDYINNLPRYGGGNN